MKTYFEFVNEMGTSEKSSLGSFVINIIEHMLKWDNTSGVEHEQNRRLWRQTLMIQQRELGELIADKPSLKPELARMDLAKPFQRAVRRVRDAFPDASLPPHCPYTLQQVLGVDVWRKLQKRD